MLIGSLTWWYLKQSLPLRCVFGEGARGIEIHLLSIASASLETKYGAIKNNFTGTSLVVQGLRILLSLQGTLGSLVWKDPTCCN